MLTFSGGRGVKSSAYEFGGGHTIGDGGLVTKSCPTIATPWTVAHQAPLSHNPLGSQESDMT